MSGVAALNVGRLVENALVWMVVNSLCFTTSGVIVGSCCSISAIPPVTCGVAMLVPLDAKWTPSASMSPGVWA